MKVNVFLIFIFIVYILCDVAWTTKLKMICYYNTSSVLRPGYASFKTYDLENALPLCDAIIYGHIGIQARTFKPTSLHHEQHQQFTMINNLKKKYKNVKFILSLGGGQDSWRENKYLKLLESPMAIKEEFIKNILKVLTTYKFDGFDLAYPLPKHFRNNSKSTYGSNYRFEMTKLIRTMKSRFHKDYLSLSLTIMSNTYVDVYYDMPAIVDSLDFITLAAFDYSNPQETPSKANYFAPLYAPDKHHTTTNVNFTVQQWWTHHKLPFEKINLGIAVFARTWNTTKPLKDPKMPITKLLKGPAPGGYNTRTTGLLAWPEMCKKLSKITNVSKKYFGSFAYRPASPPNKQGLLITYDDLDSIREKVKFAQAKKLHGIALFDLSYDDFRGKCRGERYVMLKAIKKLLN